jgi:arylsulfatase A-like enzyme
MIVVVDTLRADRLHCYGAARDTSPIIDRIAADGVLFEQAFTVAPSTWQAFTSILTGLNPPRHGVRFIFDEPLTSTIPSLGTILEQHGYATVSFDVIPFLRWMTDGHGFQSYVDSDSLKKGGTIPDAQLTDQIVSWVGAHRDKQPFFVFVRYQGPHWKYNPKQEFHDLFGTDAGADHSFNDGDYGLRFEQDEKGRPQFRLVDPAARRHLMFDFNLAPPVRDHMILHYDACVRTVDEQIGRVVDALRSAELLDTTLLVITADHGESFGEHGYLRHGPRVDDVVMRVPLIMRFPPAATHGHAGERVPQLVRSIDIMPTVLATVGITAPAGLQGRSLLPAVDNGQELNLTAYGETAGEFVGVDDQVVAEGVAGKHRMLRTARWKLVYVPDGKAGVYRLYDMTGRGDDEDVGVVHPDALAEMQAELDTILAADPRAGSRGPAKRPLTDAEKERLRALGYL